jgi:hypothetical protein
MNLAYLATACGSPAYAAPVRIDKRFAIIFYCMSIGNHRWNELSRGCGKKIFS